MRSLKWKPRGEWELIKAPWGDDVGWLLSGPTPLSRTLRPSVPTWVTRVRPLPPKPALQVPLRRSGLVWKELAVRAEKHGVSSPGP